MIAVAIHFQLHPLAKICVRQRTSQDSDRQRTFGMCRTAALLPVCCRTSSTPVYGSVSTNSACLSSCSALLLALVMDAAAAAVLERAGVVLPACCCRILLRLTGWLCRKPTKLTVVPWRCLGMGHRVVQESVLGLACVLGCAGMPCAAGLPALLVLSTSCFLCASKVPAARDVMVVCWESCASEARASPLQEPCLEVQKRWPSRGIDAAGMPQPSSSTVKLHAAMLAVTWMLRAPAWMLFSTSSHAAAGRSAACAVERNVSVTCCGSRLIGFDDM